MIAWKQREGREQEEEIDLAAGGDAASGSERNSMLPKSAPHREGMRDDPAMLKEQQRRSLASWQQDGMRKLHEAALDPVKHFADMDLSYGSTREEGAAMLIAESYLRLANGGRSYRNAIGRDIARDRVAQEHFEGRGAGSDVEFGRQVIGRARKAEAGIELFAHLSRSASTAEIVRAAMGQGDAMTWPQWLTEAPKHPGYDPEREAEYLEKWNEVTSGTRERTASIATPLTDVFQALRGGDLNPAKFAEGLRSEHRENFLASLRILAETLPANEQASFWNNLSRTADRFTMEAAQNIADFATTPFEVPEPAEPRSVWTNDEVGNFFRNLERGNYEQTKRNREASEAEQARILARKNLRDDINRIRDTVYDPVKALNPEGTWARFGEDIAYSLPGMAGYAATAAIPGGVVAIYADAKGRIYTELRHGLMESMGEQGASEFAEKWSGVGAVPSVLIERLQLAAPLRRVPGLEKLLDGATRRIGNKLLRAGGRVTLTGLGETGAEEVQNVLPSLIREVGSLMDEKVEGVEWLNGKNGYLDGFWYRSAVSFGTMLPLAMLAGLPGRGPAGRNRDLLGASDLELRALGIAPDQVAAIRAAESKGEYRLNAAVDWALATRDPMSEDAKSAVAEMETRAREEERMLEQAKESGAWPLIRMRPGGKGWTVHDPESGEEVGTATRIGEAIRIGRAHFDGKREADRVAKGGEDKSSGNSLPVVQSRSDGKLEIRYPDGRREAVASREEAGRAQEAWLRQHFERQRQLSQRGIRDRDAAFEEEAARYDAARPGVSRTEITPETLGDLRRRGALTISQAWQRVRDYSAQSGASLEGFMPADFDRFAVKGAASAEARFAGGVLQGAIQLVKGEKDVATLWEEHAETWMHAQLNPGGSWTEADLRDELRRLEVQTGRSFLAGDSRAHLIEGFSHVARNYAAGHHADLNFGEKLRHFLNLLAEKMAAVFTLAGDLKRLSTEGGLSPELETALRESLGFGAAEGVAKYDVDRSMEGQAPRASGYAGLAVPPEGLGRLLGSLSVGEGDGGRRRQDEFVHKVWSALAQHDELFQYGRTTSKDAAEIAKAVSVPGMEVRSEDHGNWIGFEGKNGFLAILNADTDRPIISSPLAGSQGVENGGGAQLYAAALDWIHNNGKKVTDDSSLSEIGAIRRTSHFLASALRWGTTKHLEPHADQKVEGWGEDEAGNFAALARREKENAFTVIPEARDWTFNFRSGRFEHGDGRAVTREEIATAVTRGRPGESGIGFSTVQRAVFTASTLQELERGRAAYALESAASSMLDSALEGVSYSIAPIGPGAREIVSAPEVLSSKASPFSGVTATTPREWRPVWAAWLKANKKEWAGEGPVPTPEGPIAITNQTADHVRAVRDGEKAALHFEAAVRMRELLENSVLAYVGSTKEGEVSASEVHRRYAWMTFSDGETRHVLLTVKRWDESRDADADTAYAVEALEVKGATDGTLQASKKDDKAITGSAEDNLARFCSGIKPEHRK